MITPTENNMTPQETVDALDRYIIGQTDAKKAVAIALRNRWRRLQLGEDLKDEILPKNIIMIGATGIGKTEIARRISRLVNAPFIKVEASKFTEVGYVGRDVESMIRDLTDNSVNMVRQEQMERKQDAAREMVEERLLNLFFRLQKANRMILKKKQHQIRHEKSSARNFVQENWIKGLLNWT